MANALLNAWASARIICLNAQLHPWLERSSYRPVPLLTSSGLAKITSARSPIIPAGTIAGRPSADRLADPGL